MTETEIIAGECCSYSSGKVHHTVTVLSAAS